MNEGILALQDQVRGRSGTLVVFLFRELLSDYGARYLILLGGVAVLVMSVSPQRLRGLVSQRWGASLFPVQRRAST